VTVGAFPFYLIRVPEKAKNRGNVARKLGEKGNRVRRKGTMYRAPTGSTALHRFQRGGQSGRY
jgi:hypothetical protein